MEECRTRDRNKASREEELLREHSSSVTVLATSARSTARKHYDKTVPANDRGFLLRFGIASR